MNKRELEEAYNDANDMVQKLQAHCVELHKELDEHRNLDNRQRRLIEILIHASLEVMDADGNLVSQYLYIEGELDASSD